MVVSNIDVATNFVSLVRMYLGCWGKNTMRLTKEELRTLHAVVKAAGFNPQKVVLEQGYGYNRDQDGSALGKFVINETCPVCVKNASGILNKTSTGWLNELVGCVASKLGQQSPEAECVTWVVNEIVRSVPLVPIRLTVLGEFLQENPPSMRGSSFLVDHVRDEDSFTDCGGDVGVHSFCKGLLAFRQVTRQENVLHCRACGLRLHYPISVTTYGALRAYFQKHPQDV